MLFFVVAWKELMPNTMAEVPGKNQLFGRRRSLPVPFLPAHPLLSPKEIGVYLHVCNRAVLDLYQIDLGLKPAFIFPYLSCFCFLFYKMKTMMATIQNSYKDLAR